jgi:hypothetical protein
VFHMVRDGDVLDKLNRYETQLMNQLARVMGEREKSARATQRADRDPAACGGVTAVSRAWLALREANKKGNAGLASPAA